MAEHPAHRSDCGRWSDGEEFVIPSSELLDCQTAEEVDKLSSVLLKDFGPRLLAAPKCSPWSF
jgi:hypothetical protein